LLSQSSRRYAPSTAPAGPVASFARKPRTSTSTNSEHKSVPTFQTSIDGSTRPKQPESPIALFKLDSGLSKSTRISTVDFQPPTQEQLQGKTPPPISSSVAIRTNIADDREAIEPTAYQVKSLSTAEDIRRPSQGSEGQYSSTDITVPLSLSKDRFSPITKINRQLDAQNDRVDNFQKEEETCLFPNEECNDGLRKPLNRNQIPKPEPRMPDVSERNSKR